MSDQLKSQIRTWWPIAMGQLTTLLVTYIAARLGVDVPGEAAYAFVSVVVTGLVYALGRSLETSDHTLLRGIGRFIVSLGLNTGQPTYTRTVPGVTMHRGPPPYGR